MDLDVVHRVVFTPGGWVAVGIGLDCETGIPGSINSDMVYLKVRRPMTNLNTLISSFYFNPILKGCVAGTCQPEVGTCCEVNTKSGRRGFFDIYFTVTVFDDDWIVFRTMNVLEQL